MAISAKEGAAIGAAAALLGPFAPVGVLTPLLFGGAGFGLAKAFGGGGNKNKNALDSVAARASNDTSLDPMVQYIAKQYGAPRGKHPEYWWNELEGRTQNYLNSLSPEELTNYLSTYDPQKLQSDFASVYGGGVPMKHIDKYTNLYKNVSDTMGEDFDPNVIAQLLPAYQEGNTAGNAALAAWEQQYKQSTPYLKRQSGKYSGDVNQVFNDLMQRGATQGELDHFGQMLATGETDLYELSQYVQSLPEFQTQADTKFRSGLANELQGYDTQFFKKATPEILDQYSKAGIQNSSALDFAMTDLMGNIASKRGEYLAGLSSQQYGGNKEAARQDYLASMNNYLGGLQNNQQRAYGLMDYYNQRGDARTDYNLQRQDYMNYLNSMNSKKRGGMGSALGSLAGAGLGALLAAPTGGMSMGAGAMLGSTLGQSGGGLYDYWN